MSSEDTKTLNFNQYQKADETPFIIYAGYECLLEKTDGCKNNPKNPSKTKVGEHTPSGFSMSTISSFKSIENKHDMYRGEGEKLCESLREHKMEIINFKKK